MALFEFCIKHANAFIKGVNTRRPGAVFTALVAYMALLEHLIVHHYGPDVEEAGELWSAVRENFLALSALHCEQINVAPKNTTTFH